MSKALECSGFSFYPVFFFFFLSLNEMARGGGQRGRGDFQGRRPRFLRPNARGRNRALELSEYRQATEMALLSMRVTSPIPIPC